MTTTNTQTVLFDPGYAQHTTILSISAEYFYANINQFKNLGQRKMKFKMFYPQIIRMVENNVGFCLGSLLWATYIKTIKNATIEGNPCLGGPYDKAETVEEADYSIEFFERLKKDVKYYLGLEYSINPIYIKILELYKEFLTLNSGFVSTKTTDDVILPQGFKTPDKDAAAKIYSKTQEVIQNGNLLELLDVFDLAYEG